MRGVFGIVSLLIVLAVVGIVATRQLKTAGPPAGPSLSAGEATAVPQPARQQQVKDEVTKALQQGAARMEDAVK